MMQTAALRREDGLGLGVAVVLHVALVAVLLVQRSGDYAPVQVERVTVSLAEDVGLVAEAPVPVPESRAAIAPELAPLPEPPRPQAAPRRPTTQQRQTERPQPRQTQRPQPRETQQATPRGTRIGDGFLSGAGSSTTTEETRLPASQIGASARASLVQAIAREIKPHWQPPSGPEVEEIVTILRFNLREDGSLAGRPSVVRQTGVNDINRAQADRHAELAIRAVQRAAPFDLPAEYYNAWNNVTAFSFDWKLSQ